MASFAAVCRASARGATQQLRNHASRRGKQPPIQVCVGITDSYVAFHPGQAALAAQNFNMPALSPTMTEGNIATWKIKEGTTDHAECPAPRLEQQPIDKPKYSQRRY